MQCVLVGAFIGRSICSSRRCQTRGRGGAEQRSGGYVTSNVKTVWGTGSSHWGSHGEPGNSRRRCARILVCSYTHSTVHFSESWIYPRRVTPGIVLPVPAFIMTEMLLDVAHTIRRLRWHLLAGGSGNFFYVNGGLSLALQLSTLRLKERLSL